MTVAKSKIYTLAEYLELTEIDRDRVCELENGILREMPPESWENTKIVNYLISLILQVLPFERFTNKAEIIVSGSRVSARIPDLIVLSEEGLAELNNYGRSTITLDMPPPILVVEVVSPGKVNRDRDYRYKRSEYAARGIRYYWIIDPQDQKFISLELVDGLYEEKTCDRSVSSISFKLPVEIEIDFSVLFSTI